MNLIKKIEIFCTKYSEKIENIFVLLLTIVCSCQSIFSKNFSYLDEMIMFFFFLFEIFKIFINKEKIEKSKIIIFSIFLFVTFFNALIKPYNKLSYIIEIINYLKPFLLIEFICLIKMDNNRFNKYMKYYLVINCISIVWGLFYYIFYDKIGYTPGDKFRNGNYRVEGLAGHPINFAFMCLTVCIYLFEKKEKKFLGWFLVALSLIGVWLSATRLCIAVTGFYFVYKFINYILNKNPEKRNLIKKIIICSCTVSVILFGIIFSGKIKNYLSNEIENTIRMFSIKKTFEIFPNYPILGTGIGTYDCASSVKYDSYVYKDFDFSRFEDKMNNSSRGVFESSVSKWIIETGIFGITIMSILLWSYYKKSHHISNDASKYLFYVIIINSILNTFYKIPLMLCYALYQANDSYNFQNKYISKNNKISMIGHKRIPSREGGVEVVVEELATRMVERGYDVTCYNRGGKHVAGSEFSNKELKKYKGIKLKKVITIDKKGLAAMTSSFFATIRALFSKAEVVHYHAEGPCAMMWIIKWFSNKKMIATIHGLDWQRAKWGGFATKYIKFGEKMAVKYADEIIVLSENVKKYFKDTYNRETIFIPNGVNKPKIINASIITKKYNLKKDDYILYLGRIVPEKGIHYLIEAFNKIKTNKKLVIAGGASDTDSYYSEIKEIAKKDNRIILTGFVQGKELQELFSNAYIYCLPSDLEGMPLSLLEAMSYGNCCLTSDIDECSEVLEDKGVTFEKSNVKDLEEKLNCLILNEDKVREYKDNAQEFILNKYNWDDVTDKTLELYKS